MEGKRILKIEASAGSGKTYALTFEYLKTLLKAFSEKKDVKKSAILKSILAITFTNKAVNEMKERILNKLKSFSMGKKNLSERDMSFIKKLSDETGLNEEQIIKLSREILEVILCCFSDFNVKTIDSLMSSIIKVISHELELKPDFEIGVDSADIIDETLYSFINETAEKNWEQIEKLFEDYFLVDKLNTWTPEKKIENKIKPLYFISLKKEFDLKAEDYDIKKIHKTIESLTERLIDNIDTNLSKIMEVGLKKGLFDGRRIKTSLIEKLREFSREAKEGYHDGYFYVEKLLGGKFFKYKNPSEFIKGGDEELKNDFINAYLEAKSTLSEIVYNISILKVASFVNFFENFLNYYMEKVGKKQVYVEELSKKIRTKLEEWKESGPSYIYLKLSDRFFHYLIDEFQDTSELQFKALAPLIDEVLSREENSSLFIVGDRKQAIYRWRGGRAELMDELEEILPSIKYVSSVEKDLNKSLLYNFRSGKRIVEFNNAFFSKENLASLVENSDVLEVLLKNFENSSQKTVREEEGFVKVKFYYKPKEDASHEKLYSAVKEMIKEALGKGFKEEDIAILVKKNVEGRELIENLSDEFSFVSDESLFISSCERINEIVSFLKFLDYPPDNFNFYVFINSDLFKKKAFSVDCNESKELFSAIESIFLEHRGQKIYKIFREMFPNLWKSLIAPFFKSVGFLPLYDLFQDFSMVYEIYDNFPEYSVYFSNFSRLLHELEGKGITSVSSFISMWDSGKLKEESVLVNFVAGKIRVITIHKSKGLEFPVVILPLEEGSRGRRGDNIFITEKGIYYVKNNYAVLNEKLKNIYAGEIAREYVDELNVLYVAMTRAKDGLFIPVVVNEKDSKNKGDKKSSDSPFERFEDFAKLFKKSSMFGADNEYVYGMLKRYESESAEMKKMENINFEGKKILSRDWKKEFLVFTSSSVVEESSYERIERGERIHKLLERITLVKDKEELKEIVLKNSSLFSLSKEDTERIFNFLLRDDVFPLFSGDFSVYNEKTILRKTSQGFEEKRIDRLILKENEVLVVDYKTGEEKLDEHFVQVKDYVEIVKEIYPQKRVKGILLYVDKNEVEEVEV